MYDLQYLDTLQNASDNCYTRMRKNLTIESVHCLFPDETVEKYNKWNFLCD